MLDVNDLRLYWTLLTCTWNPQGIWKPQVAYLHMQTLQEFHAVIVIISANSTSHEWRCIVQEHSFESCWLWYYFDLIPVVRRIFEAQCAICLLTQFLTALTNVLVSIHDNFLEFALFFARFMGWIPCSKRESYKGEEKRNREAVVRTDSKLQRSTISKQLSVTINILSSDKQIYAEITSKNYFETCLGDYTPACLNWFRLARILLTTYSHFVLIVESQSDIVDIDGRKYSAG